MRTKERKGKEVSNRVIVTVFTCVLATAFICGCATGPKGPTDEEQIMAQLEAFKAALLGKDIEGLKAVMSENWYHPEVGDREVALDFVQQGIDSGFLDDGEVDLENVEIEIEGDTATAYPIEASSPLGSVTVELEFTKENGVWLVTGGDAEGV